MYVYCLSHKKSEYVRLWWKIVVKQQLSQEKGTKNSVQKYFFVPFHRQFWTDLSTYNMWLHLFLRFSKDWKFPLLQSRIISQLFSLGNVLCVSKLLAENILFQDVKICFARCHDVTSCENTRGKQGWCKNRIVRYCANRRGAKTVQDDNVGQQLTRHLDFQGSTRE